MSAELFFSAASAVLAQSETTTPLPQMFGGPKNAFMDVLRAFGSLLVAWFVFRQIMTSFTVSRMISAGLVAGGCVWLINGGLLTIISMVAEQIAPLGPPNEWI